MSEQQSAITPNPNDSSDIYSLSTRAYMELRSRMQVDMQINYTGNADIDFMRGMIPHHQVIVDMAKLALKYCYDPEVRMLAKNIILAQDIEIKVINAWLQRHLL
ncbi:DUF305 domain-containing protein [Acinetobacter sp. Ac_3412]|uniref:CopM family metallochaperone n=1 Tax=Acinetobacter sp. Ac_3412 TaxID=1848935 RepID=UPI00148F59A8|nr:DUF305 domain-containing protein [Acinetobacter sp. Ac_3412]NNP75615.1 DUF305 domain-containing protein [Acinetobacter sp. Ac_3412]